MRRLATLTAAAVFALGFAFGGVAMANELVNPGAEVNDGPDNCSTTGWTTDPAFVAQEGAPFGVGQRNGDCHFSPTGTAVAQNTSVSMDQDVDITGCSVKALNGTWSASGFIQTQVGDFGTLTVEFFSSVPAQVEPSNITDNITSASGGGGSGDYDLFSDSGDLPGPVAVTANYRLDATNEPTGSEANVHYDDLSFTIDCVADFAKISGTKEVGTRGPKRQDPVFTFGGAVGNLESTPLVGTITINYRDIPTSCTFTPTAIVYNLDISVEIAADYLCTNSDAGTATIKMTAKDADGSCDGSDKKGRKNRGSIAVDATPDDTLDIGDSAGVSGEENCLATGNVIIDDGIV